MEVVACFCGLATGGKLFPCLRGSLLTLMTFVYRGVKDLYTTWQGAGWVASKGQVCGGDMHEVGAWESQQFRCNRASSCSCSYFSLTETPGFHPLTPFLCHLLSVSFVTRTANRYLSADFIARDYSEPRNPRTIQKLPSLGDSAIQGPEMALHERLETEPRPGSVYIES